MHFEIAFKYLLQAEGGLLISDSEHGGGANMGVSLTVLQEYFKDPSLTLENLKAMSVDTARNIYGTLYWNKMSLDLCIGELSAIVLLDQSVNRGLGGVKKALQFTLTNRYQRVVTDQDSFLTLLSHVNMVPDRQFFIQFISDAQDSYAQIAVDHPEKAKHLRGWLNRTQNLLKLLA